MPQSWLLMLHGSSFDIFLGSTCNNPYSSRHSHLPYCSLYRRGDLGEADCSASPWSGVSREGASSLRGGTGRPGRQGVCGMQVCLAGGDEEFSSLCDMSSKIWCSSALPLDCRTAAVAWTFLSVPTHCFGPEQFLLHPRQVGHQGVKRLGRPCAYLLQGLGVTGTRVAEVILSVPPAPFQFTWYLLPYLCFQ